MSGKDLIKDKDKDALLSAGIFDSADKKLSTSIEQKINENVEVSFQDFLESKNAKVEQIDNEIEKEWYDEKFNEWIDGDVTRILEQGKIDEIKSENKDIKENLIKLNFEIDLTSLAQEISDNKEKTKQTEIMKLGEDDFSIAVFGIDKKDIVNAIGDNNFKNRLDIINYLEEEKIEDIQGLFVKNGYDLGSYGESDDGIDGKFGKKTLEALQKYIQDNTLEDGVFDGSVTVETGTGQSVSGGIDNQTPVVDVNGNIIGGVDAAAGIVNPLDVVSEFIKFDEKYVNLKIGEYVELDPKRIFDNDITIETFPIGNESSFKIEDGKLLYKADSKEETFRLKLSKGDMVLYSQAVTMVAEVDDNIDQSDIYNDGKFDEFAGIMTGIKKKNSNYEKIKNNIVSEISVKRAEYISLDHELYILDLVAKYNNDNDYDFENETDKDKEEVLTKIPMTNKEIKDRKDKINNRKDAIKTLVHSLLVEEARYELVGYLHKDSTRLNSKLNNNKSEYYIEGEYITREKFMKKIEKGKINLNKCALIGLDVTWENENETYFTDIDQPNKDWHINSLIITDDPNFMKSKKLTKNEQIQYKSEGYVNLESRGKEKFNSERRALKHILGIKGLFGRGGIDDDMSIATEDYDIDNPVFKEKKNLKKLKRILMRLIKDENINIKDAFNQVNVAYENGHKINIGDKDLNKLLNMYTIYRDNSDGMIGGGDYFQKAMGLLDNYFIKEIDGFNDTNSVLDIYANEHIGRAEGLIDPDKQKKAARKLFNGEYFENINNFPVFKNSSELRKLKRIVKKIDLADVFQRGEISGGKYDDFYRLYNIYKENKKINKIDKTGYIVVVEGKGSEYYNAVFDFLVGVGEGKQDIVESVNSMIVLNDIDVSRHGENEEIRYASNEEKQFVMALADLNSDGRNDFGDRGMRMGLEIKNIWKSVAVDEKYIGLESENGVYRNLVEFAKYYMEKTGQYNLLSDLNGIGDVSTMVAEIKANPGLLNSLQNILVNSPIPMDYILKYGNDASEKYLESDKADILSKVLNNKLTIDGLEKKLDAEIQNLVRQGLDLEKIPELRAVLKPMFYGAIINNGGVNYVGVGAGLTLNTAKIGSFSLNLGVANVPTKGQAYGITMSWADSFDLSKSGNTSLDVRSSVGTSMLFVPILSQYVGLSTVFNENKLRASLDAGYIKKISIGANVALVAGLPSRGLSAGFSQDKIEGINLQYNNIKKKLSNSNGILGNVLSGIHMSLDRTEVMSSLEINLAEKLIGKKFNDLNKSDTLLVVKASENLFQGISYYDLQGVLDKNDPRLTTIIGDMAENYALQWKNEAITGSSNVHLESVGIGVQFLAGYYPIPMVTASVAWNKNMYSKETPESVATYYSQLSTGVGMTNVKSKIDTKQFLDEDGKITNHAVEYLNAKMSIAHPNIDVSDLDIKISDYIMSTKNGFESKGPQQALHIPKDLYKYVNINISSDILRNIHTYVGEDNVEYIEIPLNSKIALLDYSRTNAGKFNLIIGDTKAEMDDLMVGPNMREHFGDPTSLIPQKIVYMEVPEINNKLPNLLSIDMDDEGVVTTIEHPIDKCEKIENGMATFDLKSKITDACIDMGGVNSVLQIDKVNNKLMVPQFGTLTMYSRLDNSGNRIYEMYYSSSPNNKLDINFDVEGYIKPSTNWVSGSTETIDGVSWVSNEKDFSNIDVFDGYDGLGGIFKGIEQDLSIMDNGHGHYATFMKAAFDAGIGDVLDYSDYKDSFDALKKILNGKLVGDNNFDNLRNKINSTNVSDEEKLMIVDRFKAIFSFHPNLTNGTNDGGDLELLVARRNSYYEKLKGYDGVTNFPLIGKQYIEKILNKLKNKESLSKKEENNLFGMTAFYRHDNKEGRGYSMTQMGSTKVLGGHMESIGGGELKETKERFWNNLDKSSPHQNILIKTLVEKIGENFVTEKLIKDNLEDLLKGKDIDFVTGNGINKKIKLELDYVFYLLGECANESIGVNLKGVKILDRSVDEDEDVGVNVDGGSHSIQIIPHSEILNAGIYTNSVDSVNQNLRAGKGNVGVGLAGGIKKQSSPPPPPGPTDPNNPPPPPGPTGPDGN